MHEVRKKVSTVALAAVLLFCSVVPVPTGVAMLDRARVNQAYANPVAGTAAEMALLAFQTACIAGGIYIAGTTLSELNINSAQLYQAFSTYYTNQNNISQSELEGILAGSYMNGNIDLTALATAGITGAMPGFASYLLNGGTATSGATSTAGNTSVINTDVGQFQTIESLNDAPRVSDIQSLIREASNGGAVYYAVQIDKDRGWYARDTYRYFYYLPSEGLYFKNMDGRLAIVDSQGRIANAHFSEKVYQTDGTVYSAYGSGNRTGTGYYIGNYVSGNSTVETYLISGVSPTMTDDGLYEVATASAGAAVIADGVTAGTFAATEGIVQAFNPTAEQLQAGYDASILQGVEQAVADLGTISTGIAALDATMNGLLGVCQGIASTLSNTVVGQYCAAVTQWLGATPFGTVMGTVIDGLDDIPDAVADGAAVVAGGVAALPGALEGVIEGVLEGVFGQPLAIPGFLQDILAGVQAIPGALEGAIEGINIPGPEWPELPRPESGGEPFQIALPPAMQADFEADLRERVPFCYVIHMKDAVDNLSGNLSYSSGAGLRAQSNYNMRSFYFDVDIPFAGPVHFDAEPFLSQPFGALDIATTIRILATALLCFGLLYRSYKVVERSF